MASSGGYLNGSLGHTWDGMVWIHLAQNRDQYQASVNTLMNLRFL
jgi:hypothetical protein